MFRCQFAIGVTVESRKANFVVNQGIQCTNAKTPEFVFNTLMESYNNQELAQELIDNGDIIELSNNIKSNKYELNDFGLRSEKTFTCVSDINEYAKLLPYTPCIFFFCTRLQRWLFFTYKQVNNNTTGYAIRPHDVASLATKQVITNKLLTVS